MKEPGPGVIPPHLTQETAEPEMENMHGLHYWFEPMFFLVLFLLSPLGFGGGPDILIIELDLYTSNIFIRFSLK